jgi:actin
MKLLKNLEKMQNAPAVIFDNGSGVFKAGMGDDYTPRVVFPTIVGKPEKPNLMVGMDQKELYVGPEAYQKRQLLLLEHPIKRGFIETKEDMEKMEKIWQHTYENELVVDPRESPVLLTETPLNDIKKREELLELFFENFKVKSFYLGI